MPIETFKKKPIHVDATQWDGTQKSATEIRHWTQPHPSEQPWFLTLDDPHTTKALSATSIDAFKTNGYTATVYDESHSAWLGVHTNDWIIKGLQNEFYPCAPDDFQTIYEPA